MTFEDMTCPRCGNKLRYYDSVRRHLRVEYGGVKTISVPRYRCDACKRTLRVLPDYILPYKQYRADIVNGFVTGRLNLSLIEYEDHPDVSTIDRWFRTFYNSFYGTNRLL
jgi:hypothetical protein